jgi:hypothetical protein
MSLNAYYYGFDSTGSEKIDSILAAVAAAGKGAHHTEYWNEVYEWESDKLSAVDRIQNAANEAASVAKTDREIALEKALELCKEMFIANDLVLDRTFDKIDEALSM